MLKFIDRVVIRFAPLQRNARSARTFLYRLNTDKNKLLNPKCKIVVDSVDSVADPSVEVTYGRTSNAITRLMSLRPDTATLVVFDPERPSVVLEEQEIELGLVQVLPGSRIPVDGLITRGTSFIDESMLTGEPVPVHKSIGSEVMGGTVVQNGVLYIKAVNVGSETAISRIIQLVNDAQLSRAPIQAQVDRVSRVFVPTVILAAV
ncbi:hypothetical protein HK102_010590, partial [Quaeritorhiza haematococci]